MNTANQSIFRADAVRRYAQSREKQILPRFVSPHAFIYLWILLGLLIASGIFAWLMQMPVYASGRAVVINGSDDNLLLVAFLPPESRSRIRVGQRMFLDFGTAAERLGTPITTVEPGIISPNAAQRRFRLDGSATLAVPQPAAVATARLELAPDGLPASSYVGGVYTAEVEVGSRRLISLLPVIGRLAGE